MKLSLSRVAEFVSAHSDRGEFDRNAVAQGYSIDSRTVLPGELFFAVLGERLDGHDYVNLALEKGAVAAVVRKDRVDRYPSQDRLIVVEDTLVALQTLAACVRRFWGKSVIGTAFLNRKETSIIISACRSCCSSWSRSMRWR
jgi:UDP-N-acetylmuramoyl-tripeptide--D-alanyl-D-alanine ligase